MENKEIKNIKKKYKLNCSHIDCKKKLSILDLNMGKCRCNKIYCVLHRLPEIHNCSFNYIIDKDDFIKNNKCIKAKVELITTN